MIGNHETRLGGPARSSVAQATDRKKQQMRTSAGVGASRETIEANDITRQRMVVHSALTSARAERAAQLLDAPLLCFDLAMSWRSSTPIKAAAFRLVLVALKADVRFDEDDPPRRGQRPGSPGSSPAAGGRRGHPSGSCQVSAIQADNHWSAIAAEDSLVVLTINWPLVNPDPSPTRRVLRRPSTAGQTNGWPKPG